MSFGKKSKSPTITAPQVPYSPSPFSIDQFGRYSFEGGENIKKASPAEATGISLRQSLINELLPELGPAGFGTGGMGSTFADLFTKKILEKGMPELKGQYTSRGLEGSTAESRGYNDLLTQAITQGIFSGQDLVRSNVGALEGGLQEAFNRLLGITQEGRALNQQKFDLQTANANRQTTADVYNVAADVTRRNADTNALGNLAGLGGLLAFGGGGGGGTNVGGQALGSTLSKTGGATSGGGGSSTSSFL